MKYLCMIFIDEDKLNALSPAELQALDDKSLAYDKRLQEGGYLLAAQALESVKAAATVRLRNNELLVTDGPFAEAREQIGGFVLLEARDRSEAIQLASQIPVISLGDIEVRPIKELTAGDGVGVKP